MRELHVELKNNSYPIVISDKFDYLKEYITKNSNRCVIVTDTNIEKLYLEDLRFECEKIFKEVLVFVVEAGENSKSLTVTGKIYDFLMENSITRKDVLISFGGGVVGDLGGFVAATYLRGISFIQVPTSLLAQVDSSVGGKTAVNLQKIKNVVGAFYQPKIVYVNHSVLKSLPIEEIRNGLVEILVHAIIKDEELFDFIETNLAEILNLNANLIEELIYRNCKIKAEVVQKDEKELGERAILNFGHTFGHAIESFYDYKYRHGECVAVGIIGSCYLAEKMQLITAETTNRIKSILERMQVLHKIHNFNSDEIIDNMRHDKKVLDGKINFILPVKIGQVIKCEINDLKDLEEVLDRLQLM